MRLLQRLILQLVVAFMFAAAPSVAFASPTITSVTLSDGLSPAQGPLTGGTEIFVNGYDFIIDGSTHVNIANNATVGVKAAIVDVAR